MSRRMSRRMSQERGSALLAVSLLATLVATGAARADSIPLRAASSAPPAQPVERVDGVTRTGEPTIRVRFDLRRLETSARFAGGQPFQQIAVDGLPLTSDVGAPRLPFYAMVLPASVGEIAVSVDAGAPVDVAKLRPAPAEPEDCRCDVARKPFVFSTKAYRSSNSFYKIESIGDYRGQPVSRVIIYPQRYDARASRLSVYPRAAFSVRIQRAGAATSVSALFSAEADADADVRSVGRRKYDYLIVTPRAFAASLGRWILWKHVHQGLRFKMLFTDERAMPLPLAELTALIKREYAQSRPLYALIVGNDRIVPAHRVTTSSSTSTASDLPFFTMGGADDIIPDMLSGRLVVDSAAQVESAVDRWLAYERGLQPPQGLEHVIGIASNQGTAPSDNEYVQSMETRLHDSLGSTIAHFWQNDAVNSNPTVFNQEMGKGAMWVTYLGHGSGTSWPSFNVQYGVSDVTRMDNADDLKPIWIDVACQNGDIVAGNAGERLTNQLDPQGRAVGVTAFYGGTVNISWHPPAILARGIAFKLAERPARAGRPYILGSLLQAGHAYLAENYSQPGALSDNQRWYVLQGDPSMVVRTP